MGCVVTAVTGTSGFPVSSSERQVLRYTERGGNVNERIRRRAGQAVAALLALDGLLHLYWATGLTWPASGQRTLSIWVLGGEVPFTPRVLLPLAAVLFTAAAAVLGRGLGRGGPWARRLLGWLTLVVAAGLLARGLVGLAWMCRVGGGSGRVFYWLNLLVYTPVCLGFGLAAACVAGVGRRSWARGTALVLPLLLTAGVLYGAYGWQPREQRGYRPAYLSAVTSQYVDTPVARFHYVRQGHGSPVVLLSPGASWVFAWRNQLAALSRTHTVYAVDLPGQGFTRLRAKHFAWNLDGMTSAIGSFLDTLGLPVVAMAGNSWSGGWALAYAQRHPQRVSRLALLAPSGLDEPDPWSWEALKMPAVGELMTNLGSGRGTVEASVRDLFVHKELVTREVVDAMWAPGTFSDNRRAMYRLERGLDWSATQKMMPFTRQPALVVWGRQDTVLPVAQAKRFGELLPNAQVHVLDGCGHALTLDCSTAVNGLMEDFLNDR